MSFSPPSTLFLSLSVRLSVKLLLSWWCLTVIVLFVVVARIMQRQASMAIRNIVSRRKDLTTVFLESGIEELLQAALKRTQRAPTVEIKAALRDLGCQVQLQEQWTGKGASMTNWAKLAMYSALLFYLRANSHKSRTEKKKKATTKTTIHALSLT